MCTAPAPRKAATGHAARPEALCTAPATQKAAAGQRARRFAR